MSVDFKKVQIQVASAEVIRSWSHGEVKKPETVNYRTLKPEKDGLFCEKIFGTTKDWECYCGKFKSLRYKGVVCDKCGVEVTHSKVRRERMGHIELSYPVAHIWYYKVIPSRIALVLDMTTINVSKVLNFENYVIIDPGESGLDVKRLISQDDYYRISEQYGDGVYASIGAEAIRELLSAVNLEAEIQELRSHLQEKIRVSDRRLLKRLEVLEDFYESNNRPEWMVLEVLPVLPPELRPMVQLEGGRFATSDLNDLYRRCINRNNRLKRLLVLKAPDIIVGNEKRMLQDAVNAIFDNTRRKRAIKGRGNRPLKSLADMLKGKQGIFRLNLLGKRVDYSGRTVIVVGPSLKLYQCGLPKKMALELFKPFLIKWLVTKEYAQNIKSAKNMIDQQRKEAFEGLAEIINEHPVLLNRAPTLHRLGIQAFFPVLIEGNAIQLHPLVCHAFNADFDGDQIACHLPLSSHALLEALMLLLSVHNLLNPANGHPIVGPTQDMILGLWYLTAEKKGDLGEGALYGALEHIEYAIARGVLGLRAKIQFVTSERTLETTPGRLMFNDLLPKEFRFVNCAIDTAEVNNIITEMYKKFDTFRLVEFLDAIKELGFYYSTHFAPTFSIGDVKIPKSKSKFMEEANKKVKKVETEHTSGIITNDERYKKLIEIWSNTNEKITEDLFDLLEEDQQGFNPVYTMAISGARGSRSQIRQLAGMRGLMAKPSGDIIELPIRSNFKEGLGVLEFFISTHGARKGLADTALKTADAGYLTRRLVDIAQDVIVKIVDCGTERGYYLSADKEGDQIIVSLRQKIYGRYLAEDIISSETDLVEFKSGELISEEIASVVEGYGYERVRVRSVLCCESESGVCVKCYGLNLAKLDVVDKGEAVGIIAAQSIGQPGTQLTMRTFHIGGTATTSSTKDRDIAPFHSIVRQITGNSVINTKGARVFVKRGSLRLVQILDSYIKKDFQELRIESGQQLVSGEEVGKISKGESGIEQVFTSFAGEVKEVGDKLFILGKEATIHLDSGYILYVSEEDEVLKNDLICKFDPFNASILVSKGGVIEFSDIVEGKTLKIEEDVASKAKIRKIIENKGGKKLMPKLLVFEKGRQVEEILLPLAAILTIESGEKVAPGSIVAKIETVAEKNRDIIGGLPRVEEIFEARIPKEACHFAEIDGIVRNLGEIIRDKRRIYIYPESLSEEEALEKRFSVLVPISKKLLVQDGDFIQGGEPLDEGPFDPHEILRVRGKYALQMYLIREVQEVYRLQGVFINDKHIEVIVSQMLRKIEVVDAGDTSFVPASTVDIVQFNRENTMIEEKGGAKATGKTTLMGLTKGALHAESFLSAASFQETTKVLTDAAIKGKHDNLVGLKENVVLGRLIPAGTGLSDYSNVKSYKNIMGDLYIEEETEDNWDGYVPDRVPALGSNA